MPRLWGSGGESKGLSAEVVQSAAAGLLWREREKGIIVEMLLVVLSEELH